MPKSILCRCDASAERGAGHVMRCMALAQAARVAEIRVTFVMQQGTAELEEQLHSEGCDVVHVTAENDIHMTSAIAKEHSAEWIVVDGYTFNAEYQQSIKKAGYKVLFIDDFGHCDHYSADIVLNQNIYAEESFYKNRESYVNLLLGSKYLLLRQEFLLAKRDRISHQSSKNVLIIMGGFDTHSVTEKVQHALKNTGVDMRVARHVTNIPELMTWADCAVSAAGTATYELAYMDVPIAMVIVAENQKRVAESMAKAGYGVNLGWYKDLQDDAIRGAVAAALLESHGTGRATQSSLIDGYGTQRVLAELFDWKLWLRPAKEEDCRLLFEWANDPEVRASSFSPDPVTWENHQEWFRKKCADANCFIFLGIDRNENPVGQVRFDIEGKFANVDVHIAPSMRRQGVGPALIDAGIVRLFSRTGVSEVHAHIKVSNEASMRAFTKAGFEKVGKKTVKGVEVFYAVRTRL